MPQIQNVRLSAVARAALALEWHLDLTPGEQPGQVEVQVKRSERPVFAWGDPDATAVAVVRNRNQHVDRGLTLHRRYRDFAYRLRAINPATGEIHEAGPFTLDVTPEPVALEMARRHQLVLRRYAGVPTGIAIARTAGETQRCPHCWDALRQRRTRSHCQLCFDTGFCHTGYYTPLLAYVEITGPNRQVQHTVFGELEAGETTGFTANFPRLSPRDLLIAPAGRRYRVEAVQPVDHRGFRVAQFLRLREVPPADIEYQLPVPPEVATALARVEGSAVHDQRVP